MNEKTSKIGCRLRWAAVAVAAAATLTTAGRVAAGTEAGPGRAPVVTPAEAPPSDPYSTCLHAGPMTADRFEARAAECRIRAEALYADPSFVGCLRRAATTPDALEHWLEACRLITSG